MRNKPRIRIRSDGWIVHDGGHCPVPNDTYGAIMFRDGVQCYGRLDTLFWGTVSDNDSFKIVAYRLT
jgi:hypothetical protein